MGKCYEVSTQSMTLATAVARPMHLGRTPYRVVPPILAAVSARYGVTVEQLKGKRRNQHMSQPRQVAMWCLRKANLSYAEIGLVLGNRSHVAVMHGVRRVNAALRDDPGQEAWLVALVSGGGVS